MCLTMLDKTSLCCIRSVLYVLKPAKRADFSMIGRFVNFLLGPKERHWREPAGSAECGLTLIKACVNLGSEK